MAPRYNYKKPGTISTSPKLVRQAYIKNKANCPTLPESGFRIGELVRLYGSSTDEYIVLDETCVEEQTAVAPQERCAIGLFGGRDNHTSFRVVFQSRIKGRITKPKTRHGRGD